MNNIKPHMFRSKKKSIIKVMVIFALFFFFYQFGLVLFLDNTQSKNDFQRSNSIKVSTSKKLVLGTLAEDAHRYRPDDNNMFTCFTSNAKIPFSFVNDDYCDCPDDGSDEPGTNACNNGTFYCETQVMRRSRPQGVPSHKVNDGICDCCDGSDEWKTFNSTNLSKLIVQNKPSCKYSC